MPRQARSFVAPTRRVRALLLGVALTAVVTGAAGCQPSKAVPARWTGSGQQVPPRLAPGGPARCSAAAYVVGDSRRMLEHVVLPLTTDRVWAAELGTPGGPLVGGMRHVRYLAESGVVHERFRADLAALMAACGRDERPLIFDFMGTNYGSLNPYRIGDPAFYDELRQEIAGFYADVAPNARVVLAELTLDRTDPDPDVRASVELFLSGYNGVLRDLARTSPSRFFFLPVPPVYDGTVTWRDTRHETAEPLMDEYSGITPTGALDATGLALISQSGVCGLTEDPLFGAEHNSEVVTLIAYLQDFRRSLAAARWLGAGSPSRPGSWRSTPAPACAF